ncbi:MAG: protein kinase domain-containing protein [Ktedonobacteraceae bacterium]
MPLEGTQLGHYRLIKQIGGGGMSEVYLAQDLNIQGRQVAIKLVRAEVAPYPDSDSVKDSGKLFQREARAVSLLDRHPHILPLYDFGEEHVHGASVTYLVMPYNPEGSLVNWLRRRSNRGVLTPVEVEYIISQAAEALQYAHNQGIIHQDVKPSNFLIQRTTEANLPYIQLADFGIAKVTTGTGSVSQSVRGTTSYMPPEQWHGKPVPASDQYALATMAYELLTGRTPFQGDLARLMYLHTYEKPQAPSTFNPRLSADIDTVILHALEKEPGNRFRSISAFANAFQQAVRGGSGEPMAPPPPPAVDNSSAGTIYPSSQSSGTVYAGSSGAAYSMPPPTGNPYAILPAGGTDMHAKTTYPGPISSIQNVQGLYTPPVPPRQPWYRSRMTIMVTIALVILLVLSSIIIAVTSVAKSTANANANATSTAQSRNATATANAQAQATAHAQATAFAQATARVIAANPDPYPPKTGKIALIDPLNGNSSDANWSTRAGCGFGGGGYHANESKSGIFNACFLAQPVYTNFTMQVDMTAIKGDCGGIVFRANSNDGKEYLFRVCQDNQHYYLYNCPGFNKSCQNLTSNLSLDINLGLNQNNTIAIVVNGSGIDLYINGNNVDSVTDTTYSSGNIGLVASTINNTTEIVYSNLKIWM